MSTGYTRLQIALHWLIAVLIVANYIISDGMPEIFDGMLEGKPVEGLMPLFHVWAGVAVLVLVLLRLALKLLSGGAHDTAVTLQDKAAVWTHRLLYALMIAVPALGAITWFRSMEATADLHVYTMNAMMILALGHAAMALFHQYVLKDGLLLKMMRAR